MSLNFYFTSGKYSGSSLCIIGRNPISSKNRELPVVGRTGDFRMARGCSISNTYSYDAATNYGLLEYTVYVAYNADE
ncbi:UNVERIFIED_CONTAM: Dirigent protein 11 [Sesamum radiatum]|uniref:Dirigent protein n=1 Tax=Sesamum radiatum TaxID=300843 RepID=A0AAW2VNT3_SESRA